MRKKCLWWECLNDVETALVADHERKSREKEDTLRKLLDVKGAGELIQQLELEIAGHRFLRQQIVNRGLQRDRLGLRTNGQPQKMTAHKQRRLPDRHLAQSDQRHGR